MSDAINPDEKKSDHYLILHVRYLGAHQKFVDDGAARSETLAELLPRALEFFHLNEHCGPQKTYLFTHNGEVLRNTSLTLGQIAGDHERLNLDLVEQFEQG